MTAAPQSPVAPEQPDELDAILEDLDVRCPKCFDEGHGGDGCEYCWKHPVRREAIDKAKAALILWADKRALLQTERVVSKLRLEYANTPIKDRSNGWDWLGKVPAALKSHFSNGEEPVTGCVYTDKPGF